MNRSIVFAALLAGVGLGAWTSYTGPLTPPGLDFGAIASTLQQYLRPRPVEAPASVSAAVTDDYQRSNAILLNTALSVEDEPPLPVMDAAADINQKAAPNEACGAWGISEAGIEAVLQEMIRHGWTPPTRSDALALSQPIGRAPIEAIDPGLLALPVSDPDNGDRALADHQSSLADQTS